MNEFYKKYLFVPKSGTGKVREKVMLTRIGISIALIIVCMAAMSFTAYAYFSADITSSNNVIKTANWEVDVEAESDVTFNEGYYLLDNSANSNERIYVFTVKKGQNANATLGYSRIDVKNDTDNYLSVQTFYTEPIGQFLVDGNIVTDIDRVIKIAVPAGRIFKAQFIAEWGSCAKQPIIEEGNGISLQNIQSSSDDLNQDETDLKNDTASSQESTVEDANEGVEQNTQTNSIPNASTESSVSNTEENE